MCVCVYRPILALFSDGLISSDTNLFLFCKYTNHLQVLSAEWLYVKPRESVCVRPVREGFGSGGPPGEAGPFTSAHKMAAATAAALAALFVGDNGPKSKTGSPLRGNARPASELVKELFCISEGAACLMADTRRGNLAALRPCKRKKKRGKNKNALTFDL